MRGVQFSDFHSALQMAITTLQSQDQTEAPSYGFQLSEFLEKICDTNTSIKEIEFVHNARTDLKLVNVTGILLTLSSVT